jgi:hypothetical protein
MISGSLRSIHILLVSSDPQYGPIVRCVDHFLILLTAANDVLAVWKFVTSEVGASQLKINPKRIALFGSSAGSALAGGVAIRLKNDGTQVQPLLTILDR